MEIEIRLDIDNMATLVAALMVFDEELHDAMKSDAPGIIGQSIRKTANEAHADMVRLRDKISAAMTDAGIPDVPDISDAVKTMEVDPVSDMHWWFN